MYLNIFCFTFCTYLLIPNQLETFLLCNSYLLEWISPFGQFLTVFRKKYYFRRLFDNETSENPPSWIFNVHRNVIGQPFEPFENCIFQQENPPFCTFFQYYDINWNYRKKLRRIINDLQWPYDKEIWKMLGIL